MDIFLIPARSGSKRLKNKNIISFFGKPMISYSIKTAIKCNLFKKIIVSTDSNKIAKISENIDSIYNVALEHFHPNNSTINNSHLNDVTNDDPLMDSGRDRDAFVKDK